MTENQNVCGLRKKDFRTTVNGKQTDLFILRNSKGCEVAVTNYGGAIVAIMVPDKDGQLANVIQGHSNIEGVINSAEQYLSTLIGRFGNRICKGHFVLGGKEYQLALNDGSNHLHGGLVGWNKRVWDAFQMNEQSVAMSLSSPYGEEGFTGEMKVTVEYTWTDDNELKIEYLATTNKKTIVNLTHHAFFSLTGLADPTPTVDELECEVNADFYLPIDATSIPTGEILKVAGTPFDFRTPKALGPAMNADDEQIRNGSGVDHNFVLNKREFGELSFAARITEPNSGRTMECWTTEPGLQVYTGNFQSNYPINDGCTAQRRSAICLEAQHFPDSPNRAYFPPVVLNPGERYRQTTVYKFGVKM